VPRPQPGPGPGIRLPTWAKRQPIHLWPLIAIRWLCLQIGRTKPGAADASPNPSPHSGLFPVFLALRHPLAATGCAAGARSSRLPFSILSLPFSPSALLMPPASRRKGARRTGARKEAFDGRGWRRREALRRCTRVAVRGPVEWPCDQCPLVRVRACASTRQQRCGSLIWTGGELAQEIGSAVGPLSPRVMAVVTATREPGRSLPSVHLSVFI